MQKRVEEETYEEQDAPSDEVFSSREDEDRTFNSQVRRDVRTQLKQATDRGTDVDSAMKDAQPFSRQTLNCLRRRHAG